MTSIKTLSGWGRWPKRDCHTDTLDPQTALPLAGTDTGLTRGMGRSYGDAALNPDLTLMGTARNRITSFDAETGELVAEAGVTLQDILEAFVPRGWFPPVTPGTKFVTLGGLVAADAHGKNHHGHGSFGDHVLWLDLLCADGETRRCAPDQNAGLFRATIGGVGLTGHILTVALRLLPVESAWIVQETKPAANLDEALEIFEMSQDATYSVAWIDCLATGEAQGRSLVMLGEHATMADLSAEQKSAPLTLPPNKKKRMPLDAPSWALNKWTIRAFNALYYRSGKKAPPREVVDYDSYFYPLDAIDDWNRLYGARGFAQYQCALPLDTARDGLSALLQEISDAGMGSFLAVLKRFGKGAPDRPLSFPMEGYTLALDFALSPQSLTLLDRLDEIVVAREGRLYLAKDSRMTQATFEAGYGPALDQFRAIRTETGADRAFSSLLSKRLGL
ncbi:MAG: FAD-binding oxidoreductase [Litoreibacter sp.]|uniref:FAD-binding oxidoreductase n=1 Tax=Litoreibacter sp. TaxID=1969459 RepID=UPI003298FE46